MEQVKSIGIIGAGLSGLVTSKTCLEYGYKIQVFEKGEELGGVWTSTRRYPGLTTQNTKDTYFFSDFRCQNTLMNGPVEKMCSHT